MNLLRIIQKSKKPKLNNMAIKHVGEIKHLSEYEPCERIIAGEIISDFNRRAYNEFFEKGKCHLDPVENAVSGSLGFLDFKQNIYVKINSIYLAFIGVEPDYRGQGIGKKLILELENIAIERKIQKIWLNIEPKRFRELSSFYSNLGYKKENNKPAYKTICKRMSKIL